MLHQIYKDKVVCQIVSTSEVDLSEPEIMDELTFRIDRGYYKPVVESDVIKKSRELDEDRNIKSMKRSLAPSISIH